MATSDNRRPIEQYLHKDKKRANNPEIGLVNPETDKDLPKTKYEYDPHIDPQLQWSGKEDRNEFEVPTISLHVHERVDPRTIIEKAISNKGITSYGQGLLFETWTEHKPIREAIEFYKHEQNWANRLVAGDSLLVMNSLLEKEGMGEKVQMVYIDPPYGIKFGSNFQPFVNKRDVKDGNDQDLSSEPEMIRAFRDTWEKGIHSYLTYLRDRIKLAHHLLNATGSIFVQINDDNLAYVMSVLQETFGANNFVNVIPFRKRASYLTRERGVFELFDYIVWFAKDMDKMKFHQLYKEQNLLYELDKTKYNYYDNPDGSIRTIGVKDFTDPNFDPNLAYRRHTLIQNTDKPKNVFNLRIYGKEIPLPKGNEWKTNEDGIKRLLEDNRIYGDKPSVMYKIRFGDFPYSPINNLWDDTSAEQHPIYAVQTDKISIMRCILMTTDPGDLVLDPTCGSGSTAYISEMFGRRWITCDTSRVAITLAKQRLMTAYFDYYQLVNDEEGVSSGFKYKEIPHLSLRSIAEGIPPKLEVLYDQPIIDRTKHRVTGPFTVESVPAPSTLTLEESITQGKADASVTRTGETLRQSEWRDELLKTGIRGKSGQYITFSRVEAKLGTRWIQAEGETEDGKRVLIVFGPEYAPMEQRQVELALREAESLRPTPEMIIFLAFQFDSEAAKDIDEINWKDVTLLRAQMNADLFTEDLKKKRSSEDSFWLIGQPDIQVKTINSGENKGKYQVEVLGFDYYNTKTGNVESGGPNKIAMWMLDTDYDERSLFPTQIFFPMAGKNEGWGKLAKNLKAELDEEKIEAFSGTLSLPFDRGTYNQIAVKIIDDRGIESIRVIKLSN